MIRTENLTKKFIRNEAVHALNLEVPQGSVFALIGPNGAGKSTVIKMLMNLLRPSAGRAEILGVDSRKLGPQQLATIGYVSENQRLPEWMTVQGLMNYCKPFYPAWDDGEAAELLRSFELPVNRKLSALSRGMRVKAALASSLAYHPKLIVLDEPFSGLDVLVRDQLIESILERTPDSTVFLASHDLAEIESFATHIAYVNEGNLQFVEEMGALSERFREVEVTLEQPTANAAELPVSWLNPELSGVVVRFADSAFQPQVIQSEIRKRFGAVKDISTRSMTLRAIVVALAKSARSGRVMA